MEPNSSLAGNNDSPSQTLYFDPIGDVLLILNSGPSTKIFVVSANAMSLAYEAWNRILAPGGPSLEAQQCSKREIPLSDDNESALSTLLNIAHLRFAAVPRHLTFSELLAVSVLTDKYGATSMVIPWIDTWLDVVKSLLEAPLHEEWLWIAWEFGDMKSFESLANSLVNTVRQDQNGKSVTEAGMFLDPQDEDTFPPPGIIESILEARQTYHLKDVEHLPPARGPADSGALSKQYFMRRQQEKA